jgi:hypothetical protein
MQVLGRKLKKADDGAAQILIRRFLRCVYVDVDVDVSMSVDICVFVYMHLSLSLFIVCITPVL